MSVFANQISPVKKGTGTENGHKQLSIIFYIVGALITLYGVFCYLIGDLQWGAFAERVAVYKDAYNRFLETGKAMTFAEGFGYYTIKFSVVIILLGLLLILNGNMMHGQRWARYKDFICVMPALFCLALFVY